MRIVTLFLLSAGAPGYALLRAHFGWKVWLTLLGTWVLPYSLVKISDALARWTFGNLPPPLLVTALDNYRQFTATVYLLLLFATIPMLLELPVMVWRAIGPRDSRLAAADAGTAFWDPPTVLSLLPDISRAILLATGIASQFGYLDYDRPFPRLDLVHVTVIFAAAVCLIRLATVNGNHFPGLGRGSRQVYPIWRFRTRVTRGAGRKADGLAAVFSRRPRDLRAISGDR